MNKLCFWVFMLASSIYDVSCRPHPWGERVLRDVEDEVAESSEEITSESRYEAVPIDSVWSNVVNQLSKLNRIYAVMENAQKRLEGFAERVEADLNHEMSRMFEDSETRTKRHVPHEIPLIRDNEGYWATEKWSTSWTAVIGADWKVTYGTLSMTPFVHKDIVFWIATSIYHRDNPGVTGVYMMTMVGDQPRIQYSQIIGTKGANECIPILMNDDFIEIVCAESFGGETTIKPTQRGSCVIRVTWTTGSLDAKVVRTLATRNAVDVTTFSYGGDIYVAFSSYYDMIRATYETTSTVIKVTTGKYSGSWFTSYEYVDSTRMVTYGASAITSFSIRSQKFIAVANHHTDLGETEIYSEIFIFDDIESHRIISFQKILTKAARGIAYFSFKRSFQHEHFIAIANEYTVIDGEIVYETESMIYKFVDGKFIPFQCIPTNGAWQFVSYQGENGELLIAVVNSRIENGVHLYQYDGWRFVRLFGIEIGTKIGVNHVSITKVKEEIWITVCDPEDEDNWKPQVFSFIFVHKNPLAEFHDHSYEWCLTRKQTLVTSNLTALIITIDGLPKTTEPITFHQNVTFESNLVVDAEEHSVVHSTIYEQDGDRIWGTRVEDAINGQKAECDELASTLITLHSKYNSSMKVDNVKLDLVIFSTVTVNADIESVSVITNYYNDHNVNWDLYINFISMVDVDIHLTNVLVEETSNYIYTIVFLNGQSIQAGDCVYLNQDVTITAYTTFNSLITSSMTVTTLETANFLLVTGSQSITGHYTVNLVDIDGISITYINNINLNDFLNILVINDGRAIVIDGEITVKVNVKTDFFYTETISGQILFNIVSSVFRTDVLSLQQISGDFACGWMIAANIVIDGTLNEIIVPDGIFLQNSEYDLTNVIVTFNSITSIRIRIEQRLSEIQVLENYKLDILRVGYTETVTGIKKFYQIYLGGTSIVNGTVASIQIEDLVFESLVLKKLIGNRLEGNVRFEGGLTVTTGFVGDVDLNRIINYAIPLSKDAFQIHCLATQTSCTQLNVNQIFVFNQQVQVTGNFEANTLNNIVIEEYATLKGIHTFTTELTFYESMVSQSSIEVNLVNGIDLSLLVSSLWLTTGGTLLYDVAFNYLTVQNVVSTICTFGTYDISDLVLLHQDVVISADWIFNTMTWTGTSLSISTAMMIEVGTLDGVLFTDLFLPTLKRNSTTIQVLTGTNIQIQRLVAVSLIGFGLDVMSEDVIYVDQDLHFQYNIEIEPEVHIEELYFTSFDGVSDFDYAFGWLFNDGSCQNLTGYNVFSGSLTVHNLEIPETDFNFLNLTKTEIEVSMSSLVNVCGAIRGAARTDQDVSLGSTMLWSDIESDYNVEVSNEVQGIDLSEEAIYVDELNTLIVIGRKDFEKPVHFIEEFWLDEHLIINDASIFHNGICEEFIHPLNLQSLNIFGNVIVHNLTAIYDFFNDYSTTTLLNVFWQVDRNVTIDTEVFISRGFFGIIDINGIILNGLVQAEIEALLSKRIRVTSDISQTITGLFSFTDLTINYLYVFDLTTSNQIIDLVNVFRRDIYQEISGSWTVKVINNIDSVSLNFWLIGTLNGISLANFVRHNQWALISAQKYFKFDVTVNQNLNVEIWYLVQDVDISLWAEQALYIDQDYVLDFGVTFETTAHFNNKLIVHGLVDNIVMASTFLFTKSEDQTLFMNTLICQNLEMKSSLTVNDGNVFGVNLNRISSAAVFIDQDVIIKETTYFSEELTLGDITLNLFNGINITMLGDFLTSTYQKLITDTITYLYEKCNSISVTIEESAVEFWYWKTTHEFKSKGEDIFLYPVSVQPNSKFMPGNRFIDPSILMLKGFDVLKLLNWNVTTNTYDMYFQYNFKYTSGAVGLGNNFLAVCSYRQPTDALQDDIFMPKYFNTSVILDQYTSGNDMKFGHIYNIEDGFPKVVSSFPVNGCVDIFAFTINDRQCIAPLNFRSDIVTIICYNEVFSTFEYFTTLQVKQPYQAKWISYSKFTYIFVGSMAIIDNGISTLNIFKINENGESVLQNKIEMKVVQFEFSVLQLDSQHHDLLVVLQKASRVANAFIRICHLTYDENGIISVAEIKDLHHDLLSSATRLSLTVTIDKRPLIVVETSTMIVFFTGTPMGTDFRLHSKIHLSAGRTTNMEAFVDETTKKIHVASSFIGTSQYDYYSFMDDKTVSSSYIYSSIYRPDFVFEEDADIFK